LNGVGEDGQRQHGQTDASGRNAIDDLYLPTSRAMLNSPLGRPDARQSHAKVGVYMRLDPDIVDAFKADGPGWQTRVNDEFAKVVRRRKPVA
jgi:uncharacterized protein (DUF4415 family)